MHINTPLLESLPLNRLCGRRVFLKMESQQPVGSFKIRGMGLLCIHLAKEGAKRFVSSSGGNAGIAIAYAGRMLSIPVTVVVPKTTLPLMHEKLSLEGAEVIVHGKDWNEADAFAQQMCNEKETCYIHPFDHPLLWQGYASLIHEVKRSGLKPDAVVVAVGGGGLFCGMVQGLHEVGWNDVPVFTAETTGAASLAASVKAGRLITLDKIDTIALSLGAKRIAEQAFTWTQTHPVFPQVVSDADTVNAILRFADDQRVLVEPACGAALALIYERCPALLHYGKILVIVCGGNGVSLELLQRWKNDSQ